MFPPILITADPSKHHEALMVKAVWNAQLFAVPEMREREKEIYKYFLISYRKGNLSFVKEALPGSVVKLVNINPGFLV